MDNSTSQLALNLALATLMVALTTIVHFWGLLGLTALMGRAHKRLRTHESQLRQAGMILLVVCGVFVLHTAQIWLYAAAYRALGELGSFEQALYFSTASFSTVGYGDLTLSERWRLLGAIEGANGLILIAWSTAFLMTVTARLRLLEHEWLDRPKQ